MGRVLLRAFRWTVSHLPAVIAWGALGGLFWYGVSHDWKFFQGEETESKKPEEPHDHEHEPFTPYDLPQPNGVAVQVTHDPKRCPSLDKTVKLPSPEAVAKAGITTRVLDFEWVSPEVFAHGEVVQDPRFMATVSPRVGGTLLTVEKQAGDPVRKGELLALVESAEVGKAKANLLTARAIAEGRERVVASLENGVSRPAAWSRPRPQPGKPGRVYIALARPSSISGSRYRLKKSACRRIPSSPGSSFWASPPTNRPTCSLKPRPMADNSRPTCCRSSARSPGL